MSDPVAVVCLQTTGSVTVSVAPSAGGTAAYYFRWWTEQAKPAVGEDEVSFVELVNAADYRVAVYPRDPGADPAMDFESPPFTDASVEVTLQGSYTLVSAGSGNPWPPT